MRGNHNQNIFKIYFELKSQIKETKLNRSKFGSLKRLLSSVNEVGEAGADSALGCITSSVSCKKGGKPSDSIHTK